MILTLEKPSSSLLNISRMFHLHNLIWWNKITIISRLLLDLPTLKTSVINVCFEKFYFDNFEVIFAQMKLIFSKRSLPIYADHFLLKNLLYTLHKIGDSFSYVKMMPVQMSKAFVQRLWLIYRQTWRHKSSLTILTGIKLRPYQLLKLLFSWKNLFIRFVLSTTNVD